jgi:flagellar hook assembly protein FlgD
LQHQVISIPTPLDENEVHIEPEIFSPSVPGQDFARINYRFDQTALAANVKIVDQQGRVIKVIANNETLGFEGFFRWDGDRDDGSKARMGYYFVWFETFDLTGTVKTYRKRVVIGR